MIRLLACALLVIVFSGGQLFAQESAARSLPSPANKKGAQNQPDAKANGKAPADAGKPKDADNDPVKKAFGGGLGPTTNQAVTTEIYSDEAYFDSAKSIGVFTGKVQVRDPRFNLQADKLTVYLGKGDAKGLERAVAEGNVGMLRETPGEDGGPPTRAVGRADTAVYTAKDGNVELRGTPRVQSGVNSHIATSPDTVMIINQGGQLQTTGPSRTEIRQEPKNPAPAPAAPAPSPKP